MSATGRSDVRDPRDFYRTPIGVTRAIARHLPRGGRVLDAGCGDGAILEGLLAEGFERPMGMELDADLARRARLRTHGRASVQQGDFLKSGVGPLDLVVMNPPYGNAMAFVERALRLVAEQRGTVAALLRLNWLGSRGRADFHRAFPSDLYILTPRPSFVGGGSDATEYAWLLWGPDRGNRWQILRWSDAPVSVATEERP